MIRAMLIDDHPVIRAGFKSFIECSKNIEVVAESDNGLNAMPIVTQTLPNVVIVDLDMPKMDGIDFTMWLRQAHPQIKSIILSSSTEECHIANSLKAGAKGFLLKSISAEILIRSIEEVFNNRTALDPQIADKLVSILTSAGSTTDVATLTQRELEVLKQVAKGESNKDIGCNLHVSGRTVQGHLHNIFEKLHVRSRTEAVAKAVSMKMLMLDELSFVAHEQRAQAV